MAATLLRKIVLASGALAAATGAQARTEAGAAAPTLFSPLAVSPAQQATAGAARLDSTLSYLSETGTLKSAAATLTPASTTKLTATQPLVAVGGVVPLGPLKVGLSGTYSKIFLRTDSATDTDPQSTSFGFVDTVSSVTPLVAAELGLGVAVGAQYTYLDTALRDGADTPAAQGGDTQREWGNRGKVGVLWAVNGMTLGLAYETRMRRLAAPPAVILHGAVPVGASGALGAQVIYRFNKDIDDDNSRPENAVDVLGSYSLKTGARGELTLLAGYLPMTLQIDPERFSVLRSFGWGWRFGVDWDAELRRALELGLGFVYEKLSSSLSEKMDGTTLGLRARLTWRI